MEYVKTDEPMLQWHPVFFAGIRIEFCEEENKMDFESEHQLGTKELLRQRNGEYNRVQANITKKTSSLFHKGLLNKVDAAIIKGSTAISNGRYFLFTFHKRIINTPLPFCHLRMPRTYTNTVPYRT